MATFITVLNDGETFTDSDGVYTCSVEAGDIEQIEEDLRENRVRNDSEIFWTRRERV